MNIPERLWRVVRGHIAVARERAEGPTLDEAVAELFAAVEASEVAVAEVPEFPARRLPPASSQPREPFEASYRELQLEPGCNLAALEAAYYARLAEIHPELHLDGSPERQRLDARKAAVVEAYERLRDAINITETRFEKLELDH